MTPALLSVNDAAAYLGISRATVYRLAAECGAGKGPRVTKVRGRSMFKRAELDAYIERQTLSTRWSA
jgi:excisionase family DNA binding protein